MSAWQDMYRDIHNAWLQRPERERRWLVWGAVVLVLAAVWVFGVSPAWRVWREAPLRQATLQAQTRQMLQLQAEARQLQTPRRIEREEALRLLSASATSLLGPGTQLTPKGDVLGVSLKSAPATELAQWLIQAREQALAQPIQAQLLRDDNSEFDATWSGTLVLRLH